MSHDFYLGNYKTVKKKRKQSLLTEGPQGLARCLEPL